MKETLVLILFTLSGLSTASESFITEYKFVARKMTWPDAHIYCRERSSDLASVHDSHESDTLLEMMVGSESSVRVWIGLYDNMRMWKWSLGDEDYNRVQGYSNWWPGEPNFLHAEESCVLMVTGDGQWIDFPCEEEYPAVCYYEPGPAKYIYVETKMSWYQAQKYCRHNYTDLASVRNVSEYQNFSKLLTGGWSWMGLHRNTWSTWSDNSKRTYTRWARSQPDNYNNASESCVAMDTTTALWYDYGCNRQYEFICQKMTLSPSTPEATHHHQTIRLKMQSEADLKDAAVQRQILQQLHDRLGNHGLPGLKLHWVETDGESFHKEPKTETVEGSDC